MKVLCIVAHPDDEVLGAGATLAGHALAGDDVHILILTDGVSSRQSANMGDRQDRFDMAQKAAQALRVNSPEILGLADQQLDSYSLLERTRDVEKTIKNLQPNTIYTHHIGDLNLDHAICARAVLTACRPLPECSVRHIYAMEVASSTEWAPEHPFVPNRFVRITPETRTAKRIALEAYAAEMRLYPHARSLPAIEALEVRRGTSVGLNIAEAFMIVREIA